MSWKAFLVIYLLPLFLQFVSISMQAMMPPLIFNITVRPDIFTQILQTDYSTEYLEEWMTQIKQHIQNKKLSELIMPGTHNSGAYIRLQSESMVKHPDWNQDRLSFAPDSILNGRRWAYSHDGSLLEQLENGFRVLDLQIVNSFGKFCWFYRRVIGHDITADLLDVRHFANKHPQEVIILRLHLTAKSDRRTLHQLMKTCLGTRLADSYESHLTVRQIVEKEKTIIPMYSLIRLCSANKYNLKEMTGNCFLHVKHHYTNPTDMYWFITKILTKVGSNPHHNITFINTAIEVSPIVSVLPFIHILHTLCLPVMSLLIILLFLIGYMPLLKSLRACSGLKRRTLTSYMIIVTITSLSVYIAIELLLDFLGFKGVAVDSMNLGKLANIYGENIMSKDLELEADTINRQIRFISSGGPHKEGINFMLHHWLARPQKYKGAFFLVDHFRSSKLVQLAIKANQGILKKQINLNFIGSPIAGSAGVKRFFTCPSIHIAYAIVSHDEGKVIASEVIPEGSTTILEEDQYPMDANCIVMVSGASGTWYPLYHGNIQRWIDSAQDFYIRGTEMYNVKGYAYISTVDNLRTSTCKSNPPDKNILNITKWGL